MRHNRVGVLVGAGFVLVGTVLNRFNVSWFAMRPVNGEVYSPHWMEVAILVGVVATAVLAYSLVAHYFPLFDETVVVTPAQTRARSNPRAILSPEATGD